MAQSQLAPVIQELKELKGNNDSFREAAATNDNKVIRLVSGMQMVINQQKSDLNSLTNTISNVEEKSDRTQQSVQQQNSLISQSIANQQRILQTLGSLSKQIKTIQSLQIEANDNFQQQIADNSQFKRMMQWFNKLSTAGKLATGAAGVGAIGAGAALGKTAMDFFSKDYTPPPQSSSSDQQTPNTPGGQTPASMPQQKASPTSAGMTTLQTQSGKSYQVAAQYADKFQGFVNELEKTGYKINSIGGYSDRNIAGTNIKSWHAKGMAIDINPQDNPVTYRGQPGAGKTNLPSNISQIAAKYGLGWGGNWRNKLDTMHFSFGPNEGGTGKGSNEIGSEETGGKDKQQPLSPAVPISLPGTGGGAPQAAPVEAPSAGTTPAATPSATSGGAPSMTPASAAAPMEAPAPGASSKSPSQSAQVETGTSSTKGISPREKALLDAISTGESPGYNVIVGGKKFTDYSHHPGIIGVRTKFGPSTAAGRYQFVKTTWDRIVKQYNAENPNNPINDFSPGAQDRAALFLAQQDYRRRTGRDLRSDLNSNDPNVKKNLGRLLQSGLGGTGADTTWQSFQPKYRSAENIGADLEKRTAQNQAESSGEITAPVPGAMPSQSPEQQASVATSQSPGAQTEQTQKDAEKVSGPPPSAEQQAKEAKEASPARQTEMGTASNEGISGKSLEGVNSDLANKLKRAAAEYKQQTGQAITVTSGLRSKEKQAQLYEAFRAGRSRFPANPPGKSNHETGNAVDVSSAQASALERMGLLRKYGLYRPSPKGDAVHIQLQGTGITQASYGSGGGGGGHEGHQHAEAQPQQTEAPQQSMAMAASTQDAQPMEQAPRSMEAPQTIQQAAVETAVGMAPQVIQNVQMAAGGGGSVPSQVGGFLAMASGENSVYTFGKSIGDAYEKLYGPFGKYNYEHKHG